MFSLSPSDDIAATPPVQALADDDNNSPNSSPSPVPLSIGNASVPNDRTAPSSGHNGTVNSRNWGFYTEEDDLEDEEVGRSEE